MRAATTAIDLVSLWDNIGSLPFIGGAKLMVAPNAGKQLRIAETRPTAAREPLAIIPYDVKSAEADLSGRPGGSAAT
jgi:hypothetical protein